jgi:predicted GIY-YIG superfamily endonuclease
VYFVYIFQSEVLDLFHVGVTTDLKRRQQEYIAMLADSACPDPLRGRVFSEAYSTMLEARERALKMKAWDRKAMIEALDR